MKCLIDKLKTMEEVKSVKHSFKNNWFMLKLTCKYSPKFIFFEIIWGILGGINESAVVIFTKIFYDCLEKTTPFSTVAMVIGIMITYLILFNGFGKWYTNVFAPIQKEKISMGMETFLFAKARELDLELYDNPAFYDDFIWSMSECNERGIGLVESIAAFFKYILGIGITISVMASVSTELAVVAIICTIISIITSRIEMKISYEKDTKLNPLNRKAEYLERIFSTPDYAKEVG